MHGFQICLLHLNKKLGDFWLELLDAPTEALGWTGGVLSARGEGGIGDDDSLLKTHTRKVGNFLSDFSRKRLTFTLYLFCGFLTNEKKTQTTL